jgi:DedD protein
VNIQLKQRLVGAIVLVALAVIFIPMLLPGEGSLSDAIQGSNIPPEPDYRFPPIKEAPKAPAMAEAPPVPLGDEAGDKPAAAEEMTKAVAPASDKKASAAGTATKTPPVETKAPAPKVAKTPTEAKANPGTTSKASHLPRASGWVVQVGSFSNSTNAKALRDRLRKMGYASFVEAVSGKGGGVFRVRVGPELTRAKAEQLQQRLQKEAKLKGLVQSYP